MTKVRNLEFGGLKIQRPKQLGVENIKIAFTEVLDGVKKIKLAVQQLSQKPFDYRAVFSLAILLGEYSTKLPIFQMALEEFKDGISPLESQKLSVHFSETFDLENDELESVIEEGIFLIPDTYVFVNQALDLGGRWQSFYNKLQPFLRRAA